MRSRGGEHEEGVDMEDMSSRLNVERILNCRTVYRAPSIMLLKVILLKMFGGVICNSNSKLCKFNFIHC